MALLHGFRLAVLLMVRCPEWPLNLQAHVRNAKCNLLLRCTIGRSICSTTLMGQGLPPTNENSAHTRFSSEGRIAPEVSGVYSVEPEERNHWQRSRPAAKSRSKDRKSEAVRLAGRRML